MAILGLMLMWFVILTLFIGWAWIVFVAIGEDDSAAVALCAFVPLYIFIFAIARINKLGSRLQLFQWVCSDSC